MGGRTRSCGTNVSCTDTTCAATSLVSHQFQVCCTSIYLISMRICQKQVSRAAWLHHADMWLTACQTSTYGNLVCCSCHTKSSVCTHTSCNNRHCTDYVHDLPPIQGATQKSLYLLNRLRCHDLCVNDWLSCNLLLNLLLWDDLCHNFLVHTTQLRGAGHMTNTSASRLNNL